MDHEQAALARGSRQILRRGRPGPCLPEPVAMEHPQQRAGEKGIGAAPTRARPLSGFGMRPSRARMRTALSKRPSLAPIGDESRGSRPVAASRIGPVKPWSIVGPSFGTRR